MFYIKDNKTNLEKNNNDMNIFNKKELVVGTINNPVYYFIRYDQPQGLEFELTQAFAEYIGVNLTVKLFDNNHMLFDALNNGDIDMIAAALRYQPERSEQFNIGPSYTTASWQLAYKTGSYRPRNWSDVKSPIAIPYSQELIQVLTKYQTKFPNLVWEVKGNLAQEEILGLVDSGKYDYAIASSIELASSQQFMPHIGIAYDVTDESTVHWYFSEYLSNDLQVAAFDFMATAIATGLVERLEHKYFNHLQDFDFVDIRSYIRAIENVLPRYKPLFEKYSGDIPWYVLAAIAYQESHWDESAVSPTGVRGIMMLTKETAERMGVKDRTDPEQSIRGGAEYLKLLITKMPESILEEDKLWFALAAYNLGLGHLLDVRRLTKELGGNPDNWLDVKNNLPLLTKKEYYSRLRYGYARGNEAYNYVDNIQRYLNSIIKYHQNNNSVTGIVNEVD